ncbi:MAG: hypothetical protein CMJ46_16090 [Planctomyces sp.]|nr:hypothetical protein [Planctomyces sp.]
MLNNPEEKRRPTIVGTPPESRSSNSSGTDRGSVLPRGSSTSEAQDARSGENGFSNAVEMESVSLPVAQDEAAVRKLVTTFMEELRVPNEKAVKAVMTKDAHRDYPVEIIMVTSSDMSFEIQKVSFVGDVAFASMRMTNNKMFGYAYLQLQWETSEWRVRGLGFGDPLADEPDDEATFIDFADEPVEFYFGEFFEPIWPGPLVPDSNDVILAGTCADNGIDIELYLSYQRLGADFSFRESEPSIHALLRMKGASLEHATAFGDLNLNEAEDDQGTSLTLRENLFVDVESFNELDDPGIYTDKDSDLSNIAVEIPLSLDSPADNAKRLKRLAGSVDVLAGGEVDQINVDDVLSRLGSELNHEALEKAGVKVQVKGENSDPSSNAALVLELSGELKAVLNYELLDSDGKQLRIGTSTSLTSDNTLKSESMVILFMADRELPEDSRLVLSIAAEQKPVTVAFEFNNVELPINPQMAPAAIASDAVKASLKLDDKPPEGMFALPRERAIYASIEFSGPTIDEASEYGVFVLDRAQDDRGTTLELIASVLGDFGQPLTKAYVDRNTFPGGESPPITVNIALKQPADDAKTVDIEGSLRIRGLKTIVIDDILEKLDIPLDAPELKEFGDIIVGQPGPNEIVGAEKTLRIIVSDPETSIAKFELIDLRGNKLNISSASGDNLYYLNADAPYPPGTRLRIIPSKELSVTEIPFKFQNHPLPR